MVSGHLESLHFPRGIYVRSGLGMGNSLTGYTLVVGENDAKSGTSYEGIYDMALSLRVHKTAVGNSLHAESDSIIFITGANKGKKSTLLMAIGQAQLMMQCGMFVAAESFSTYIACSICTHFKREEDSGMAIGKLDEEMSRMSAIVTT
jgi:DNA mismatch repair ATPase MutS